MTQNRTPADATPSGSRKLILREQYEPLLSAYVLRDYQDEEWTIRSLEQEGDQFFAVADLLGISISPTDPAGFHLSISSAGKIAGLLEMAAALILLEQTEKNVEMWFVESHYKCLAPIRSPVGVSLHMACHYRATSDGARYIFKFMTAIRGSEGGEFSREITYMVPKPVS